MGLIVSRHVPDTFKRGCANVLLTTLYDSVKINYPTAVGLLTYTANILQWIESVPASNIVPVSLAIGMVATKLAKLFENRLG